jgi:hypothetical protein
MRMQVKAIVADIEDFLKAHPGVDKKLPLGASLGALHDRSVQIGLTVRACFLHALPHGV